MHTHAHTHTSAYHTRIPPKYPNAHAHTHTLLPLPVTWGLAPDPNGGASSTNKGALAVWRSRSITGPYEGPRDLITSNVGAACVNTGTVVLGPDNDTWYYLYDAIQVRPSSAVAHSRTHCLGAACALTHSLTHSLTHCLGAACALTHCLGAACALTA